MAGTAEAAAEQELGTEELGTAVAAAAAAESGKSARREQLVAERLETSRFRQRSAGTAARLAAL